MKQQRSAKGVTALAVPVAPPARQSGTPPPCRSSAEPANTSASSHIDGIPAETLNPACRQPVSLPKGIDPSMPSDQFQVVNQAPLPPSTPSPGALNFSSPTSGGQYKDHAPPSYFIPNNPAIPIPGGSPKKWRPATRPTNPGRVFAYPTAVLSRQTITVGGQTTHAQPRPDASPVRRASGSSPSCLPLGRTFSH